MGLKDKIVSLKSSLEQPKEERRNSYSDEDLAFMSSLTAAVYEKSTQKSRNLVWIIGGFFLIALIWASFATLDEVTRAQGKVIPLGQIQKVQYLEGGRVSEILISEGEVVKKGQALIKIDNIGFATRFRESEIRLQELKAKASRLKAQASGEAVFFDPVVETSFPEIVVQERSLYESSMKQLAVKTEILQEQFKQRKSELQEAKNRKVELQSRYKLLKKELSLTQPLVAKRLVSEVEFLKLERQASKLNGDLDAAKLSIPRLQSKMDEAQEAIAESKLSFSNQAKEQFNESISEIARIEQTKSLLKDKVTRAVLRSPVAGTVKQLLVNTIGGVIHPGRDVIEIVPLEVRLISEVRVRPADIAYLHVGQEAVVKFSAYDFSIHGGLRGKVVHISADTIMDEHDESYYLVRVETAKSYLGSIEKPLKIMAGMTVTVDILTGEKTVLDYLLKPIFKAQQNALRER
ncbi:MAG: HlyD family type I secretion periplasmic adaptor subunit [Thiovulaceae bacterium]|nr:HlyD family type I secretion periplasmic adaptor subunit [Sulfurimonadaceae bacterium]